MKSHQIAELDSASLKYQPIVLNLIEKYIESLEERIASLNKQNTFDKLLIEKQQLHITSNRVTPPTR